MKKYPFIFIFIIFLNCSKDKSILNSQILYYDYYPLNIGYNWFFNVVGSENNPWIKRVVQQKLEINDKKYYIVTDIYGYDRQYLTSYTDTLHVDNQGRIFKYIKNKEYLLFDFSLESGKTYKYKDYTVTIKNVGLIETPAGSFDDCIQLFFDIPISVDDEIWYTFAPNVGMIKRMYGEGPTILLNSYKF